MTAPRLLFSVLFLSSPAFSTTSVSVSSSPKGALVKIGEEVFAEYVVTDEEANKPYLWPIYGPGQTSMTRSYPMEKIDGEQQDHPHHRGLYFGHESIAGFDTWAERNTFEEQKGGKDSAKTKDRLEHLGAIQHKSFEELATVDGAARIVARSDYLDKSGKKLLEEKRTMVFSIEGENRIIDIDIELIATEGPVQVADKKDAGISIRVPTCMAVDSKLGGTLVNSEGDMNADTWAKRAKWCDYFGPVNGRQFGVAILNHPSSFRFPTYWHSRTYGLFTANPFGTMSLNPKDKDGSYKLEPQSPTRLFHRFIFHPGNEKSAKIADAWEAYSKITKP